MQKKLFIVVLLVLATGYVLMLCFAGMNMASDLTYIGGILGLLIWFLVVLPFVYRKFLKSKKEMSNETKVGTVNLGSNNPGVNNSVHDENRTGNGGHRSRPVRKSKRSTGHSTEDGKGVV